MGDILNFKYKIDKDQANKLAENLMDLYDVLGDEGFLDGTEITATNWIDFCADLVDNGTKLLTMICNISNNDTLETILSNLVEKLKEMNNDDYEDYDDDDGRFDTFAPDDVKM